MLLILRRGARGEDRRARQLFGAKPVAVRSRSFSIRLACWPESISLPFGEPFLAATRVRRALRRHLRQLREAEIEQLLAAEVGHRFIGGIGEIRADLINSV